MARSERQASVPRAVGAVTTKRNQDFGQFRPFIFLQEVARVPDFHMFELSGAWNSLLPDHLSTTRDRIPITEGRQERFLPVLEYVPGGSIRDGSRVVRCCRNQ